MAMDIGTLVAYLELDQTKFEESAKGVGKKMPGWMAGAGALAGAAVAAAFGAAFSNAVNIDAGVDRMSAQLGLTEEEADRAGKAAAGAYANAWGDSPEQMQAVTAGVLSSIAGMRDASVDELQGVVEGVQAMADGFELEADRVSQVVGQMLSTGLVGSAEEGLDLLTAAMQKVPAAVREDLVDAVDEYGPFFQAVGMSGEEAMSALVAASEKGMYGIDKTGDAVKEFGIRAGDMSQSSIDAYEAMGLSAEDMSAKAVKGGEEGAEAFQQVVQGLLDMEDPVERANAAIALFGTPLEDLGVTEIPQFLESLQGMEGGLGDVEGASKAMADELGGNMAAKWTSVQRSFEAVMTTVAGGLLPVLEPLMDWLVENPAVIGVLVGALTALAVGFTAASVAVWAMNSAILANPITWIIVGIVALIAALVLLLANWDTVVAWITEVWSGFISWITGVMEGFAAWWTDLWAGFGAWVTGVWEGFIGWITGAWSGFVTWLQGVGEGLASWWSGLWSGIGAFIEGVWSGFTSWVEGVAGGFIGFLMGAFNAYVGFWSGLWNTVKGFVVDTWNALVSWIQGVPDRVMDVFAGAGDWLVDAGRAIIQGFIDGIGAMIGAVGDAVGGVMEFVAGFFPNSPAKHGPFSGAGWMRLLGSGAAIMDQFADGMHTVEPFSDVDLSGTLFGGVVDGLNPSADTATPAAAVGSARVMHYYAAENRSLSAEEDLYAAVGSPRSPFGGSFDL